MNAGEIVDLTDSEYLALLILADGRPHRTWGRATDPNAEPWNRSEVGILNANVASRLERRGFAEYPRCECCGASLGVKATAAGDRARGQFDRDAATGEVKP